MDALIVWAVVALVIVDLLSIACILWASNLLLGFRATLRDLEERVVTGSNTSDRIEVAAGVVAHDLAASQKRADTIAADGTPGEAADAAARSDP